MKKTLIYNSEERKTIYTLATSTVTYMNHNVKYNVTQIHNEFLTFLHDKDGGFHAFKNISLLF